MKTFDLKMTAIAEEVRDLSGVTTNLGLDEMAANLDEANSEVETQADLISQITLALENASAGSGSGEDDGSYDEGYADGQQAEWNAFWDVYQLNGTRTSYENAFSGYWEARIFKPKYNITAHASTYMMFRYCAFSGDLVAHLNSLGVTLTTTGCSNFQYAFYGAKFTRIGEIDIQSALYMQSTFAACTALKTIDKLISSANTTYDASTFTSCTALENVTIQGVIGKDKFNMSHCTKLTKASLTSIITALSTTTTGLTATLSRTAVNKAFETTSGANDGSSSAEWLNLKNTRSNWTISLA